jgi:FAD dependent oxidoreductase
VILTEESDWLGGQLTTQAVPPDEHEWIEREGSTALYRSFRRKVRQYYRAWYPLSRSARSARYLNPGEGSVGTLCHEPRVALAVLTATLAPYVGSGQLRVITNIRPVSAEVLADRVMSVGFIGERDVAAADLSGDFVLDATETGDLLILAGAEHVCGSESRGTTGEPHAGVSDDSRNLQGVTVVAAIDYVADEDHTIDRPSSYEFWRSYRPPFWPGQMLSWSSPSPRTLQPTHYRFTPNPMEEYEAELARNTVLRGAPPDLWVYRRILARQTFNAGHFSSDVTLVNWPMNDYFVAPLLGVSEQESSANLESARQLTLSLIYWMQTEAPRPDGGVGWPGIRMRGDILGTADGLAKRPYVREGRRIRAEYTIVEQDVASKHGDAAIRSYDDAVGTGSYRIDLHPSTGGDNYIDIGSKRFEIPLGALIPIRLENLLPAAKNIGTTHITNGCYRLHPVEWSVGEVAGSLAAYCLANSVTPSQVRSRARHLRSFQNLLVDRGVDIRWKGRTLRNQ